jgi:uncharacterized protein (DUF2336 family)
VTAKPPHDPADFEAAKRMVQSDDPAERRAVATSPSVRPELLYYLASDREAAVRQAIAANRETPRQADLLLAADAEPGVRSVLAGKIARIAPDLPPDRLSQIEQMTVACLETLARDQATEIRAILAEALKDLPNAPNAVINRLARDVELSVCGPVLQHSPILSDEDLLDIIMSGPVAGALSAIASRRTVSASLADAIARSEDEGAVAALLRNSSAQIREETLDRILDEAPRHEPWHGPLVRRPRLPPRAVERLASFVADSLLKVLQERPDLEPGTAHRLAETVRTRVAKLTGNDVPRPRGLVDFGGEDEEEHAETAGDRAARLAKEGKLTEKLIEGSLTDGDRAFVAAALGLLSSIPMAIVERILSSRAARPVTALVWKAGLSMRLARQVQLRLAQIPPSSALNARDGVDYPLSVEEMRWQLEFFGVET